MYTASDIRLLDLTDAGWQQLEEVVANFESAWQSGMEADLSRFVPPADDPLRRRILAELIKVDQECRWQRGFRKPIENYLEEWPELKQCEDLVADLVEAECATRTSLGDDITLTALEAEICRRFPQLKSRVDTYRVGRQSFNDLRQSLSPEREVPSAPQLRPGDKFHHYEVQGFLGEGGMGTVYRVTQTVLNRPQALKIPKFAPKTEQAVKERLVLEARHASKVKHENVCLIHDAGEWQGNYYICMELVEGPPLSRLLDIGPLAPRKAAEIARKLALALQAAHKEGVLHRDIKPSNIMLTPEGEPKLMDFGLAKPARQAADIAAGEDRFCSGTPDYMSPEQACGGPIDQRSDVYGLGLVLYEMLTGGLPQLGKDAARAKTELGEICSGQDSPLAAICLKAIAADPACRYQSAAEMAEALQAYLDLVGRPPRTRRYLALAAATVFTVLGIFLVFRTNEGTLVLEIEPEDVRVEIDGAEVHLKSQRDDVRLAVGEHHLIVKKDGFETRAQSFQIRRNDKTEIFVRLERAEQLLFEDRFHGNTINSKLWKTGQSSHFSRLGAGKTAHRIKQQNGSLLLEARAEHEGGWSCAQLAWLDSAEDLRSKDDVLVEVEWSAEANFGQAAIELTDGKEPVDPEDPKSVRLLTLSGEEYSPLFSPRQRVWVNICGSAKSATVLTPAGVPHGAAAIDLGNLSVWKLRFLARAGTSAGWPPSRVAVHIHRVRVTRLPPRASVSGRVIDELANRGIPGAEVRFGSEKAISNPDGTFVLRTAPGKQPLHADAAGYQQLDPPVVSIEPGRRTLANVRMKRTQFGYGDVVASIPLSQAVQSLAIGPNAIYFTVGRGTTSPLLCQIDLEGRHEVELGTISISPAQKDLPDALAAGAPHVYSVGSGMT